MAQTIQTIEIATVMRAALADVVPNGTAVYARGVPTDEDGTPNNNVTKNERRTPCVDIIPRERLPHFHASSLQEFAVIVRAFTNYDDDPFQVDLYTLCDAVGNYLADAPSLTLTLSEFDALVLQDAPEIDLEMEQMQEWQVTVKTRQTA